MGNFNCRQGVSLIVVAHTTHAEIFTLLALALAKGNHPPFDFAVVDEAQGVSGTPAAEFLDDLMNRGGV